MFIQLPLLLELSLLTKNTWICAPCSQSRMSRMKGPLPSLPAPFTGVSPLQIRLKPVTDVPNTALVWICLPFIVNFLQLLEHSPCTLFRTWVSLSSTHSKTFCWYSENLLHISLWDYQYFCQVVSLRVCAAGSRENWNKCLRDVAFRVLWKLFEASSESPLRVPPGAGMGWERDREEIRTMWTVPG